MKATEMDNRVEALLFASGDPISIEKLAECAGLKGTQVEQSLERLEERYLPTALQIMQVGKGHFQITTRAEHGAHIKYLLDERKDAPLSSAALEVLAIVAYNEPVTKSFIEQVRGVDSSGVVTNLLQKNLLEEAGRMDLPGRPIAYKTTPNFLRCFSLGDLEDLPPVDMLFNQFVAEEKGSNEDSSQVNFYSQEEAL